MAASPDLPDLDELALELVRLQHREAELERRLTKAQDRNSAFPNEVNSRHVANLYGELVELRGRMNTVRAELLPIMRVPAP